MNEDQAIAAFAALSNKTRLRVLKALVAAGSAGLSAGQIAQQVQGSPSRTSFHLAAMADAGLIRQHRQARQMIYTVDFAAMASVVQYLLQDCCANDPAVLSCCAVPMGRT